MNTRWNAEAAAAMARRTRLNVPETIPQGRPGAILPYRVVYVGDGGDFAWGMLVGALTLAAGYYLPQLITTIWRSF